VLERFREGADPWALHTIRSTRRPGEQDLIGCFYRAIPTRLDPSMLELRASIEDVIALPRRDRHEVGGRTHVSMLALQEFLPRTGARAFFNFYNFADVRALGSIRQLHGHFFHRPDEVHLVVIRRPDGYELRTRFHTSTFTEQRLLARLEAVTAQVLRGAETIADCDWLLADEHPRSPAHLQVEVPAEVAFERQAATTPDARALTLAGEHLSYRELDAAANRIAHRLIADGVGAGSLVGVHIDRSFEQIAAILGILKAGGAYVPVDPEYPAERVRFILEDSAVQILLGRAPSEASPALRVLPVDDVRTASADQP